MSAATTTPLTAPADQFAYAKELLFDAIDQHNDPAAIRLIGRLRSELDGHALLIGKRLSDNGQAWAANAAFDKGSETKREATKQQRRVDALCNDRRLVTGLTAGDLRPGHIDAIITAAKQAGRETAAIPDDVLADVANSSVDQARVPLQQWVADQTRQDDVEKEYERQRSMRRVVRHTNRTLNLPGITIEGDKATIDQIYARLDALADELYREDGGRDAGKPERTTTQRRFDAVAALLAGNKANPSRGSSSRPPVVATISLDKLLDPSNRSAVAEQLGSGPLSNAQLLDLLRGDNPIRLLVTNMTGEALWLGRSKRHASVAQFIALAIRDRGCVLCGAGIDRCVAHHILPYHAPGQGLTDLDNLVLLCASCHHHRVHNPGLTIERDASGNWTTRPALPREIPPVRADPGTGKANSTRPEQRAPAAPGTKSGPRARRDAGAGDPTGTRPDP